MTYNKTLHKVEFLMEDRSLAVSIQAGSTSLSNYLVIWVFHFFIISIYLFVVLLGKGDVVWGSR